MRSVIPKGLKGKDLFAFVVKNEALLLHAKKSAVKYADSCTSANVFIDDKGTLVSKAAKDAPVISSDASVMNLAVAINTTIYFDQHYDVHIPGLWNKSLSDNRKNGFYLLKAHRADFEYVIGEGLKGSAETLAWKDLGFDFTGVTEALMFRGNIDKDRNPFMFEQYAKRRVKQHSVGMQYVKMVTCINDDDYPVQKENWDKYRPMVVNGADADEEGFFWAVLEAKVTEGSAVLFGSNDATPAFETEEIKNLSDSTVKEPEEATPDQPHEPSFLEHIGKTKFITV